MLLNRILPIICTGECRRYYSSILFIFANACSLLSQPNREAADLQSLEVAVIATPLSYPPGSAFPVPGNSHRHNGITYGKPGGSRHA